MRLHQWAKNVLIFVPLILGGKSGSSAAWWMALIGFLAMGFAASAAYIANDIRDIPHDREHRSKRARPLASGQLSVTGGITLAVVCAAIGFALAAYAGPNAAIILALYIVMSLSYSFYCKLIPILDAFVLASLFTLRLVMGIALTDVRLSVWLLIFSMFTFLSLSLAKRHTEVLSVTDGGSVAIAGRGYVRSDAPLILAIGVSAAMASVMVMILYLIQDAYPRDFYAHPGCLWALPALLFLFLGRIWLLSERRELHDDPVAFAVKDRVSLLLGALTVLALAAALARFGAS